MAQPTGSTDTATATAAPVEPDVEPATVLKSLSATRTMSHTSNKPAEPTDSPLAWTMLAYARRQFGQQKNDIGTTVAASSTVPTTGTAAPSVAATSIAGEPNGPVVIGADGTVYQVTTDSGGTRVSVIGSDGQVLATTDDIAGRPNIYSQAVTRPDGALIVVTSNDRGNRSVVSTVDSAGTVTTVATVIGQPSALTVGADGALYMRTFVPTIFSPDGAADYRLVRLSAADTVRSFPSDTAVSVAPDGSAYLVSSAFGISTLRVIDTGGATKTIALPFGADPSDPVIDADGNAYVAVGVRTLFGGQNTRLYTLDGTTSTIRTIHGLPGETVVTADGGYLETHTFDGFTDPFVRGTTYVSHITANTIETSDAIDGRTVSGLQVTPGGTVYVALYTPGLEETRVAVVDPTSNVTVATLPGQIVLTNAADVPGSGPRTGEQGYVAYTSGEPRISRCSTPMPRSRALWNCPTAPRPRVPSSSGPTAPPTSNSSIATLRGR